jgi:hypothetical protein
MALASAPNINDPSISVVIAGADSTLATAAQADKRPQQTQNAIRDQKIQSNTCASTLFADDECRKLLRSIAIVLAADMKRARVEPYIVYGFIGFIVLWFYY